MSRHQTGYVPDFDLDHSYGYQGELLALDIARGLTDGRVEVKRDAMWAHTGRLYLETHCFASGVWKPSGLSSTTADAWAFVVGEPQVLIAVPTELLRAMAPTLHQVTMDRGSHPTRGRLLSTNRLLGSLRAPL